MPATRVRTLATRAGIIAACTALLCAPSATSVVGAASLPAVRIASQPLEDWLPEWVMQEQNIAARNGIEIIDVPTEGGTKAHLLVAAGQADMTYGATVLDMQLAAQNFVPDRAVILPVVTHIADRKHPDAALTATPSISRWKDLEGKTLATHSKASLFFVAAQYDMVRDGVDMSKVNVVELPFAEMLSAFRAGRIDAFLSGPDVAAKAEADHIGHRVINYIGEPPFDHYGVTYDLFNTKFFQAQRNTVVRFLKAEKDAIRWIAAHPEQAKEIRNRHLGFANDAVLNSLGLMNWDPKARVNPTQVRLDTEMLTNVGLISHPVEASRLFSGEDLVADSNR